MAKKNVCLRSKSLADFDRMTHRFRPPLCDLFRSFQAAERYENTRKQLQLKRDGLSELKTEERDILAEFERIRGILYNETCNVQDLYEQNENKLNRTFAKLQIETSKLDILTEKYKAVVKGMCALVNIAKIMEDFLQKSMVYKLFVDNAAKETKQFDSFSDIINKYNSLMSIFKKNTNTFNALISNLLTTRGEIIKESRTMEEQLGSLLCRLSKASKALGKESERTEQIEKKLEDLQQSGFDNEVSDVRINLYRANLLEALIASRAVDESILKEPFDIQIDIISEKFKMLSSIAKSLN